ncbi:Uncharacterised protein [Klebsiella oxytoca]|nr:Uncharacterised protein [Klebsiella oxytoca]SBL72205.1 Uncharacterised protein [Klebsiella oxytoca]SBL83853.1 Uncharacterised protein [Klebsiella oxytoca]VUS79104.1 hypothetical protein SPARK1531C2_02932 [Klebsiella grimontii]
MNSFKSPLRGFYFILLTLYEPDLQEKLNGFYIDRFVQ